MCDYPTDEGTASIFSQSGMGVDVSGPVAIRRRFYHEQAFELGVAAGHF